MNPAHSGRSRSKAVPALTFATTVLSLCYWSCTPDFDTLTSGEIDETGGTDMGGTSPVTGGSDTGGRPGSGGHAGSGTSGKGGAGGIPVNLGGAGGDANGAAGGEGGSPGEVPVGGQGGEPPVVVEPPVVRFDFESDLQGWAGVEAQIPEDCQDVVELSTAVAHEGEGSLAMIFDGEYTQPAGDPFYGVRCEAVVAPPPNATVTLWMMATSPGVGIEVYVQTEPNWGWVAMTTQSTGALPAGAWSKLTVTMPPDGVKRFGVKVYSPLDYTGSVYLDDVSW